MSEYYVSRYELNKAKNTIKRVGNQVWNLGNDYRTVLILLSGQKGLGIEGIRDQVKKLRTHSCYIREDVYALSDLLERIIRETEAADTEAMNILSGYSVNEQERIDSIVGDIILTIVHLLLNFAGALVSGRYANTSWTENPFDLMDVLLDGAEGDDLEEVIKELAKSVSEHMVEEGLTSKGMSSGSAGYVASWAVDWVEDMVENFTDGDGSFYDDIRESLVEGLVGAGKVGLTAGATCLVLSALSLTPGGIVAVGATVFIGWLVPQILDGISNMAFQNEEGFVENTGDVICDWLEQVPV